MCQKDVCCAMYVFNAQTKEKKNKDSLENKILFWDAFVSLSLSPQDFTLIFFIQSIIINLCLISVDVCVSVEARAAVFFFDFQ